MAWRIWYRRRYALRGPEGAAHRGGDRLDGGAALSAAAVRLSRRDPRRLAAERDLQGDGAAALPRHHEPVDDRRLALRPGARLARRMVARRLVAGEICVSARAHRRP